VTNVPENPASASSVYQSGAFVFDLLVTKSPAMRECLRLAQGAAGNDFAVLVTGESGTGKNLIAQAIHNASGRKAGPYVVVNCGALTESLLESELFGHEKGAFTGADESRKGRFELADGGTLVLDEIGEMSLSAQARFLQAVEYKHFQRVGGQETVTADVRVIALTNRPPAELVAEKRLREDLYYRLREVHVQMPPLRERPEDISLLCQIFLTACRQKLKKEIKCVSKAAVGCLERYHWPGNTRELKAVIRTAALTAEHDEIWVEDLGLRIEPGVPAAEITDTDLSLYALERRHITRVLKLTKGNKRRTSEILGISRPTLDKKLSGHKLDRGKFKAIKDAD